MKIAILALLGSTLATKLTMKSAQPPVRPVRPVREDYEMSDSKPPCMFEQGCHPNGMPLDFVSQPNNGTAYQRMNGPV